MEIKVKQTISFLIISYTIIFPQTAQEIIDKSEDVLRGKSSHALFEMIIETSDYTRTLRLESWWVGTERALIVTKEPKKEAGNKTLKIENEMWQYLSNTETTIKIPPSMMLQSWNGSDFTNDDLVRESDLSEDYNAKIIAEEKINDGETWKLELTPKPDAPVVWGKIYYWVRKADYLPSIVQYYDEKGKMVRYLVYSDIKKFDDRRLPSVWTMHDKTKQGNTTIIKMVEMDFNINIPDRIFSFQELERGR